jgi:nucleoid DNA-binding protein
MSKVDLVTAIANLAGLTKKAAGDALQAFLVTITASLQK